MSSYSKIVDEEMAKFKEFCKSMNLEDFKYVVHVFHEDGSTFILYHCDLWESQVASELGVPRFIGVSTEHNGDHFFFTGDLTIWRKFDMYSSSSLKE